MRGYFSVVSAYMLAALLTGAIWCSPLKAQLSTFEMSGKGVFEEGLSVEGLNLHWSTGEATQLGSYFATGGFEFSTFDYYQDAGWLGGWMGTFSSAGTLYEFVDGNGDKLVASCGDGPNGPGEFLVAITHIGRGYFVVEATFVVEFVIIPQASTGRFQNANGSWVMIAHTQPYIFGFNDPIPYEWRGHGVVTLQQPASEQRRLR